YWPIVLAAGLPLIGYGLIFNLTFAAVGVFLVFTAVYGLGTEPSTDPDAAHGDDGEGGHGDDTHDGGDDESAPAALEAPSDEAATDAPPADAGEPVPAEASSSTSNSGADE